MRTLTCCVLLFASGVGCAPRAGRLPSELPKPTPLDWAPAALRLRGIAVDTEERPLAGVEILYSECPNQVPPLCYDTGTYAAVSDSTGRFSAALPRPGAYLVLATLRGVILALERVELPRDSGAVIRLREGRR